MCLFLFVLAASSVVFVMFVAHTLRLSIRDRSVSFGGCVAPSPDFLDINRFGQPTLHGCFIYVVDPTFCGDAHDSGISGNTQFRSRIELQNMERKKHTLYIYIYLGKL